MIRNGSVNRQTVCVVEASTSTWLCIAGTMSSHLSVEDIEGAVRVTRGDDGQA